MTRALLGSPALIPITARCSELCRRPHRCASSRPPRLIHLPRVAPITEFHSNCCPCLLSLRLVPSRSRSAMGWPAAVRKLPKMLPGQQNVSLPSIESSCPVNKKYVVPCAQNNFLRPLLGCDGPRRHNSGHWVGSGQQRVYRSSEI
jgi:hypothetical protein